VNCASTPIRTILITLVVGWCSASSQAQIGGPTTAATPVQASSVSKAKLHAVRPKASASAPQFNPNLILLDPAHGATDPGGQIAPDLPEKTVTLAFANRLRPLLTARGFTVVLTREYDAPPARPAPPPDPDNPDVQPAAPPPPPPITLDQRAELANRLHPVACLLLHATSSGRGVHVFTSALNPPTNADQPRLIQLWDTAQARSISESVNLAGDLSESLSGLRIPLVTAQASIRPIDSMTCPAVAIELAPTAPNGGAATPVTDEGYQQRVAEAIATALTAWRSEAEDLLQRQAADAEREAEEAATTAASEKAGAKAKLKTKAPATSPATTPGHMVPGAIPALPSIPKIPQIVTPKAPAPKPAAPRTATPPGGLQ
jgi:N-acetylmuramoyl-L-alanine amidase